MRLKYGSPGWDNNKSDSLVASSCHISANNYVAVQIDLDPGRMNQGEESVSEIHIEGTAATVPDIEEVVNVAKDVQHREIIDVEANQQSADETMIDQENWLTIKTTTSTYKIPFTRILELFYEKLCIFNQCFPIVSIQIEL